MGKIAGTLFAATSLALAVTGCGDNSLEGEHKVVKVEEPETGRSQDMSNQNFTVTVDGETVRMSAPGEPPQTLETGGSVQYNEWYDLMNNDYARMRLMFINGKDHDMVSEYKEELSGSTTRTLIYFE